MLSARSIPTAQIMVHAFHPRVMDGTLAALDLEALMAAAAVFEGYDSAVTVIDDSVSSPSIGDDALDVRLTCL